MTDDCKRYAIYVVHLRVFWIYSENLLIVNVIPHCAIIAELYEYKASPETMWKGEEESENQIQESLVAKEISF